MQRIIIVMGLLMALTAFIHGCAAPGLKLEQGVDWTTYQIQKGVNGPVDYLLGNP